MLRAGLVFAMLGRHLSVTITLFLANDDLMDFGYREHHKAIKWASWRIWLALAE